MISLLPSAGLFAQATFSTNALDFTTTVQSAGRRARMDLHDEIILIGSIILLAGILFYLAALMVRHKHRHDPRRLEPLPAPEKARSSRRRRRKQRHEHRPRNPTLAETGGLPPKRAGDEPSSA